MQSVKIIFSVLAFFTVIGQSYSLDSLNMTLLGSWDVDTLPAQGSIQYNDIWGYTDCDGKEYAIMGSARYIHFIDISIPSAPREISAHRAGQNSVWRDIKTYQDRAYAVADQGSDGLLIFDLSQLPDTIALTNQQTDHFTRTHNIFIDEAQGRLYVIGSNTQGSGVIILDIATDPDNPVLLSSLPLPGGYIHDMYVVDHVGFAASGGNGLFVYDFTDPLNPVVLGSLTDYIGSGYNHSNWATSDLNYLVFADETHGRSLKIADISDFTDISIVSQFKSELLAPEHTSSIAHNPFIRGDYVIVSYYHDGVQVFDLSNLDSVINVAYYDTNNNHLSYSGYAGNWGVYPFFPSGLIIASDMENGLFVLSLDSIQLEAISRPENPAVSLNEIGAVSICEGETISLELNGSAEQIQWFQDGNLIAEDTTAIAVDSSGQFWAVARNKHCRLITESLDLVVNPYPEIETPYTEVTFCEGEPILEVPEGFDSYIWYRDGVLVDEITGNVLQVSESGMYQVEVVLNGCSALTDSFQVNVGTEPLAEFAYLLPPTPCEPVLLQVADNGETYKLFRNNEFLTEIELFYSIEESGDYHLLVENEFCQTETDAINVEILEPEIPVITAEDNLLTSSLAVSYQWYLNGMPISGATEQTYLAAESGAYSIEITDSQLCISQSEEIFVSVTAVDEARITGISVYPNPAKDELYILLSDQTPDLDQIRLINRIGMVIMQIDQPAKAEKISLEDLPSGIYFLEFRGKAGSLGSKKIIRI